MVIHCPRCRRPNPDHARFCHYDGQNLTSAAAQPLPSGPSRGPAAPPVPPVPGPHSGFGTVAAWDRYGAALTLIGPYLLVPGLVALRTRGVGLTSASLCCVACCAWPLGIPLLTRVWAGPTRVPGQAWGCAFRACLALALAVLLAVGIDWVSGGFAVRLLRALFDTEALARGVFGAGLGTLLGRLMARAVAPCSREMADGCRGWLMLGGGIGGALSGGLHHSPDGATFVALTLLAAGVTIGCGGALQTNRPTANQFRLKVCGRVGAPAVAAFAAFGLWQAASVPARPDAAETLWLAWIAPAPVVGPVAPPMGPEDQPTPAPAPVPAAFATPEPQPSAPPSAASEPEQRFAPEPRPAPPASRRERRVEPAAPPSSGEIVPEAKAATPTWRSSRPQNEGSVVEVRGSNVIVDLGRRHGLTMNAHLTITLGHNRKEIDAFPTRVDDETSEVELGLKTYGSPHPGDRVRVLAK